MWVVAKVKIKNLHTFKKDLVEKTDNNIKFYYPKIKYDRHEGNNIKKFEKLILEDYIFCYHKKFQRSNFINEIKFLKGLKYFLDGYNQNQNQNEIIKFINCCKTSENEEGYLTQSFFQTIITKKAKFISGPFTDMVFEILEKQKSRLKILVGNIVTTIPNKANYLYRPV
jgi:hypothetical protein|tara:strand:- start:32 stop:538 length:507 start_codon:yes stop_codon:yes gene_type:complete